MLERIIAQKREEVEHRKKEVPLPRLRERIGEQRRPSDLAAFIRGTSIKLIAEVKQASPSRGLLSTNLSPVELARTYVTAGAAAISVLTEARYFLGDIEHLMAIRETVELPLLRKDFIFEPYQIYESRAYGADALLLIAGILTLEQLKDLLSLSHSLGLKCLVEVGNESDLEKAILSQAEIIGINNRDLNTFNVDLETTRRLRPLIPKDKVVVSESGIKTRQDMEKLEQWRIDAALVGEALVTADNVSGKIRELLGVKEEAIDMAPNSSIPQGRQQTFFAGGNFDLR